MTDYLPVDCGHYDRLELAILRHRRLRLAWRDRSGAAHVERVEPVDLQTRRGEEFLVFLDAAGARRRVRLDRVFEAVEVPRQDV